MSWVTLASEGCGYLVVMEISSRKQHWEHVYATKSPTEVSWFQSVPATSLALLQEEGVGPGAHVMDVGGGDSVLVDHLLASGFTQVTVLDVSERALQRAQERLGRAADGVRWMCSDVLDVELEGELDCWHDRATFHFLTEEADIARYVEVAHRALRAGRRLVVGTFAETGPSACSGIPIRQYSRERLEQVFAPYFRPTRCLTSTHYTPAGKPQDFVFCCFQRS